jgi:putative ABC transport system permease protein
MSTVLQDIRYAIRTLVKEPGFTAVAILILAVGIGANVAMFSVTDAALLRTLPFPEADRLAMGRTTWSGRLARNVSAPDYYDYRDQSEQLESLAAVLSGSWAGLTITGGEEPERVAGTLASVDLFTTLGVEPQLGRNFTAAEAELSAPWVVQISHGLWQRRFGGSPDVVGSTLVVDGLPVTIVGVMPAGFHLFYDVDVWIPMRDGGPATGVRRFHNWVLVGRLKPDVSLETAQAEIDVISAQLQEAYPESNENKGLNLTPLHSAIVENFRPSLIMLMAAIALVLLIACGNVAGLLLARGSSRGTELSIRAAMGASGGRLARQLLTESALIAVTAGTAGIVLAVWFQRLILQFISLDTLGVVEVGLPVPTLGFALALSVGTALVFGVAPAVSGSRANPAEQLKGGARTSAGSAATRLRSTLVVSQVALSVVLLIGSGLLMRSFAEIQAVDPGFATENVLAAGVNLPDGKYADVDSRVQFYDGLLEEIRAVPGVRSAGAISMLPIRDGYSNVGAWDPQNPPDNTRRTRLAQHRRILPGYFEAIGIPLLAGRDVDRRDVADGERVLIINELMAQGLFGDEDPIGRPVAVDWGRDEPVLTRVIGVVGDVRMTRITSQPDWQMYYAYPQSAVTTMRLAIRTAGDPSLVTNAVRAILRARDPDIPLAGVGTMEQVIADSVSQTRVIMLTLTLFAWVAAFLAAIGLYSVLAYFVARRVHEIGIRVALGATRGRVVQLVLRRGLALVGIGLVVGIGGAIGVTRLIQEQLYGVAPTDLVTFAAVSVLFALVGVLACLMPGMRAARQDPVRALQAE